MLNGRKRHTLKGPAVVLLLILLNLAVFGVEPASLPAPVGAKIDQTSPAPKSEPGPPPGTYRILSDNGKVAIPFEMYKGKIRMRARINGQDCYLSLDNGSLWDELLFFGSPHVDSLGLNKTGEASVGAVKADQAYPVTVSFKDVEFLGQSAIITRYDRQAPNVWEGLDGQVSAAFFKHFVVKIDFDASLIELIPPRAFIDSGEGQPLRMGIGPFNSRTITAEVVMPSGAATTIDLLIDLGGIYPLYLPLGKDEKITLPPNSVPTTLGRGLQAQDGYLGTVKTVRLGRHVLENVPTAFTPVRQDAAIYGNTMLGLPLLRRFNLTFDYAHDQVFLQPAKAYNAPFKENR